MRIGLIVVVALGCLLLAGCSKPSKKSVESDLNYGIYEKTRAGAFQLSIASNSVAEAMTACQKAQKAVGDGSELVNALLDVQDYIDSAGNLITPYIDEPPGYETFKLGIDDRKTKLKKIIQDVYDAESDLVEAQGLLDGLNTADGSTPTELIDLIDAIDTALDDIHSAQDALKGRNRE